MKCLIIDDNKMARTFLKHHLNDLDFIELVAECENVKQAANILNKEKIDLLLLDVQMPEISGIDFLKGLFTRPLTILITSRPEYAIEAFEYNVVDFLLKPVKADRLIKSLLRAKDLFKNKTNKPMGNKDFFFFREKGLASKLVISDIKYIEAMGDYVAVHVSGKKHMVHTTMGRIEKELPDEKFLRIHRSFIVALDKIDTVENGTVYIQQTPVPVSDVYRTVLMDKLNLL